MRYVRWTGTCVTVLPVNIAIRLLAIWSATFPLELLICCLVLIAPTVITTMCVSPLLACILKEKVVVLVVALRLLPVFIALLRLAAMEAAVKAVVFLCILRVRLIVLLEATSLTVTTPTTAAPLLARALILLSVRVS